MGLICSHKLLRGPALRIVLACLVSAGISAPSAGQTNGFIENRYLQVAMFGTGQRDSINLSGRFEIIDRQTGQPILLASHLGDQGLLMNGSFITLRIDGGAPPPGSTSTRGWDVLMGDGSVGNGGWVWTRPPTEFNGRIYASGQTTAPAPIIEVTTEIHTIGDMAQFKFSIVNRDSQPHTVGLQFAQDIFFAPGTEGPIVPNVGPSLCTEVDLNGSLVPASWVRSDRPNFERTPGADPNAPIHSLGGLLRPRTVGPTFIPPDRFVAASAFFLSGQSITQSGPWDLVTSGQPDFNYCRDFWDVAVAAYWNPRTLTPGQGMEIVTFFGRNRAQLDPEPPLAVGVDAPLSLSRVQGQLQPVPTQFTAFAKNLSGITLTNITATIALTPGLELVPGKSATKSASSLVPNAEAFFSWNVRPTGTNSGRLAYSVSITAGPGLIGKSVAGEIEIPSSSTNQQILLSNPSSASGGAPSTFVNMVSIPFHLQDPNPATGIVVRDETGRQLSYGLGEFGLLRWNERLGVYENVQFIRPGEAFWLVTSRPASIACQQVTYRLDALNGIGVTTLGEFDVPLQQGWNQIGNPFQFTARLADLVVVPTDANDPDRLQPLTVDQAVTRGLILGQLYEYDPRTCSYTPPSTGFNSDMVPFRGYWLKSLRPGVRILVKPAIGRAASVARSVASDIMNGANSWALGLVAKADSAASGWNSFGVSGGASDGPDAKDVQNPPSIAPQLTVTFLRPDWPSGRAGAYLRDIQASDGRRKSWNVVVSSPAPNADVTVSWPEINRVPRGYELFVTDTSNGQRRSMRQASSLRINTGAGSSRALTITAEPRRTGAVVIGSLLARPVGRGAGTAAAISFVSSQDANVQVRILKSGGGVLRNLVTRSAAAGETTVTWDLKDNQGVSVPSGAYTIEVKASTTDGQSARQVAPYLVVR